MGGIQRRAADIPGHVHLAHRPHVPALVRRAPISYDVIDNITQGPCRRLHGASLRVQSQHVCAAVPVHRHAAGPVCQLHVGARPGLGCGLQYCAIAHRPQASTASPWLIATRVLTVSSCTRRMCRTFGLSPRDGQQRRVTPARLRNVPPDHIPKWDFDAQPPNDERDTSAAAIAASGCDACWCAVWLSPRSFLELFKYTGNQTYMDEGLQPTTRAVLKSCSHHHSDVAVDHIPWQPRRHAGRADVLCAAVHAAAAPDASAGWHDCGSNNCTIIESDYYFYEALRRFVGEWP